MPDYRMNSSVKLCVEETGYELFEPEAPPAPVRSIAITPEILAEEAAKEKARQAEVGAGSSWSAFKATLSEDNLRRGRVQVAPGRHMSVVVAEKDAKPKRAAKKSPTAKPAPKGKVHRESSPEETQEPTADLREWFADTFRPSTKPDVPQPSTERIVTMATPEFTIEKPIAASALPSNARGGRGSTYLPVLVALRALGPEQFLPVNFSDAKKGTNATAALRKLAGNENKDLIVKTVGLKRYFRLTAKAPEQK
jgi:hypothetical protein